MTELIRASAYVRVSTQEQVKNGYSLDQQIRLANEAIDEKGWTLVEVYRDEGWSGARADRPGLQSLLAALDGIDVLVVWSMDRLTRDLGIFADLSKRLNDAHVRIECLTGHIDLATPAGELHAGMDAVVGQFERKRIGERVKAMSAGRVAEGKHPGGPAPYGYRWQDKLLIVVPAEAAIVKRIYELYTSGVGQRGIVRTLNAENVATRHGGPWRQNAISRILNSAIHVGQLTVKGETVSGRHEAIIDRDLWNRARAVRTSSSRDHPGRQPESAHLLTHGLLRCSSCGSAMVPRKARPGEHERYVCGGRIANPASCSQPSIRRELIDEPFLRHLIDGHLDLEATRQRITTHITGAHGAALEQVGHAETELRRVERALVVTEQAFDAGDIDARQYGKREARLTTEIEGARNAREQAQGHANAVEHAGHFTDAERVLADHLRQLKDAASGTADAAPDLHALRNVISDLFAQVQMVKTGEWWPPGGPTGGVILPETPAPHVAVADADYWLLLSLRPLAVDYDEFRPALTPVPLVPQLQAAGADCGGSASVCAGGAERSNPTGQETPVAWLGQYPNGFLCRYCWW